MYQRKTQTTRKNYFLKPEEKAAIKKYIRENPELNNTQIGDKFGVSRGLISNIRNNK